jgi:hypothetical protein
MPITVSGLLTITKLPKDVKHVLGCNDLLRYGEVVFREHNLVVNIGLQVFSRMLGGNNGVPSIGNPGGSTPWGSAFADINDLAINQMLIGNAPNPPTPAPGDTVGVTSSGIYPEIIHQPYLTATYPTAYSVDFGGVLAASEANDEMNPANTNWYLTEEALYTRNGLLFAKRTFRVAKDASYALQVNHAFTFAEA